MVKIDLKARFWKHWFVFFAQSAENVFSFRKNSRVWTTYMCVPPIFFRIFHNVLLFFILSKKQEHVSSGAIVNFRLPCQFNKCTIIAPSESALTWTICVCNAVRYYLSRSKPSPSDDTAACPRHHLAPPTGRGCSGFAGPWLIEHKPGHDIALWQELAPGKGTPTDIATFSHCN